MLTLSHDDFKLELDFESATEGTAHAEWNFVSSHRLGEARTFTENLLGGGGEAQDGMNVQWDNATHDTYADVFAYVVGLVGEPDVRR